MSADVGYLGWRVRSSYTILKGDHLRTISSKFGLNWQSGFRQDDLSIFSNGGHLGLRAGSSDNSERGPPKDQFCQVFFFQIGPVVSEDLIKMQKANDGRTKDAQW